MIARTFALVLVLLGPPASPPAHALPAPPPPSTIARIQRTKVLRCGVVREDAEYSTADDHGSRRGFDDQLCTALAVAVLGPAATSPGGVHLSAFLDDATALQALGAGDLDVVATVSLDFTHSSAPQVQLSPPVFIDSLALLVPRAARFAHAAQLSGHTVCFLSGTAAEQSLREWFAAHHLDLLAFPFQEEGEMEAAYASHNCDALAAERTRLIGVRSAFASAAHAHIVLPEDLALDPMAIATSRQDPAWSSLVTAVVEVLLNAEQFGIGQKNTHASPLSLSQQRLLGDTAEMGAPFGLRPGWPRDVIQTVGNYGELFERTLGSGSPQGIDRGPNRLTSRGGALLPLPLK